MIARYQHPGVPISAADTRTVNQDSTPRNHRVELATNVFPNRTDSERFASRLQSESIRVLRGRTVKKFDSNLIWKLLHILHP